MEDNHFEFEDVFEDLNYEEEMEKLSIEFITEENKSFHKLMRYLTWNCSGDFTEIVKQLGFLRPAYLSVFPLDAAERA